MYEATARAVKDVDAWFQVFGLFFFNDTATTEIYTLSHTTLFRSDGPARPHRPAFRRPHRQPARDAGPARASRSEGHTSELQSRSDLVCRLLLEKKKKKYEHYFLIKKKTQKKTKKQT